MKDKTLYKQVKTAKKDYKKARAMHLELNNAMRREIIETISKIRNKYAPFLEITDQIATEKQNNFIDICGEHNEYATFNTSDIVPSMAVFMSYVEGEKFVPCHSTEAGQNSVIAKEYAVCDSDVDVSAETLETEFYRGNLILLDNGWEDTVELYDGLGTLNYSIGNYTYLHEFFNRLIQYRVEHNMKDGMNAEEIFAFMVEYLLSHKELTSKNRERREAMLGEELSTYEMDYLYQYYDEYFMENCTRLALLLKNNDAE